MKLKIKDGRGELYQWDTGRKLIIEDGANIDYLHFADFSKDDGVSYQSEVIEENGIRCCRIPNACFANESTKLVVYAVEADDDGMATTTTVVFPIRKRQKPSDYTASPEIIISAEEILRKASAKADEAESYMNTSMQYAINPVDEVISGTDKYSSLHWASKANDIYNDVVEYVGSPSDPSSALGSIDTARQSAITEIDTVRQSAITDIDAHVDTVKIDLTSYVENAESYSEEAASYASQALSYSTSASTSESNAKAAAEAAAAAESNSLSYKDLAETAKSNAQNARDEAVSAKNIAIETIVSIQGIESNVSSMKSSVDASEANVTTMQSDVSNMKASVETLKSETQTIVDNAENDVKGLLSTKADKTELAVERARIDSLSKLSEGSTTGDAELIDLRIGVDGVTYGNAGTAVRTQISDLKGDLSNLTTGGDHDKTTNYIDLTKLKENTYIKGQEQGQEVSANGFYATDFIELEEDTNYYSGNLFPGYFAFYDANKNYISGYGNGNYLTNPFTIPSGAKYGRFTIYDLSVSGNNWIYTENARPIDYAKTQKELSPDIKVSDVETQRIVDLARNIPVETSNEVTSTDLRHRNPTYIRRNNASCNWSAEDCTIENTVEYDDIAKIKRDCVKATSTSTGALIYRDIESVNAETYPLMISVFIPYTENVANYNGLMVEAYSNGLTDSDHRARGYIQFENSETTDYNSTFNRCGWVNTCVNLKSICNSVGSNFDFTDVTRIGLKFYTKSGTVRIVCLSELSFVEPMGKSGVIVIVDNFNVSVPAMADYAYSKGVRLNLSIVPGFYKGEEEAPPCASLEELERIKMQGHCIINHTYRHLNFNDYDSNTIRNEVNLAEIWMDCNGFDKSSDIISVPSARFNTNSYKALIDTNAKAIFHTWTPVVSSVGKIWYPYYPNQRCIDTSTLDSTFASDIQKAIDIAQSANTYKGVAVIGFHGTYWTLYNDGEKWRTFIDAIAESGLYSYGLDEIVDGMWY